MPRTLPVPRAPRRPRDQRGFSLVILFLIIIVMVGIAGAVMVTTQGDLQVSGSDREAKTAFYAAQAGIAAAQDYLMAPGRVGGASWSTYLGSGDIRLCGPVNLGAPLKPPTCPTANNTPDTTFDPSRSASFVYCFHNNALDPHYLDTTTGSGDITDQDNIITVESWGYAAEGAISHLILDLKFPGGRVSAPCRPGQGGCDTNQNNTGNSNVTGGSSVGTAFGG